MNKLDVHDLMNTPIPVLPEVSPMTWKAIDIREANEELCNIEATGVITDSVYASESTDSPYPDGGLEGSTLVLFAREEASSLLAVAQDMLPDNMGLVVMDAWRSITVQQSLFNQYYTALAKLHPDWREHELVAETQNYVSLPSQNPLCPSPHNTGGSFDVLLYSLPEGSNRRELDKQTILRLATLLDVGVTFDHGGEESVVRYLEDNDGLELCRQNRRLLYWIMKLAGFSAFPPEIWHYNYGNQMAAQSEGHDYAIYGAADLSAGNHVVDASRRANRDTRAISNFPIAAIIKPVA